MIWYVDSPAQSRSCRQRIGEGGSGRIDDTWSRLHLRSTRTSDPTYYSQVLQSATLSVSPLLGQSHLAYLLSGHNPILSPMPMLLITTINHCRQSCIESSASASLSKIRIASGRRPIQRFTQVMGNEAWRANTYLVAKFYLCGVVGG